MLIERLSIAFLANERFKLRIFKMRNEQIKTAQNNVIVMARIGMNLPNFA